MLSPNERRFLLGESKVSNAYARVFRYRIRKKLWKMERDLNIVRESGIDLSPKRPVKHIETKARVPIAFANALTNRRDEKEGYWEPPTY